MPYRTSPGHPSCYIQSPPPPISPSLSLLLSFWLSLSLAIQKVHMEGGKVDKNKQKKWQNIIFLCYKEKKMFNYLTLTGQQNLLDIKFEAYIAAVRASYCTSGYFQQLSPKDMTWCVCVCMCVKKMCLKDWVYRQRLLLVIISCNNLPQSLLLDWSKSNFVIICFWVYTLIIWSFILIFWL